MYMTPVLYMEFRRIPDIWSSLYRKEDGPTTTTIDGIVLFPRRNEASLARTALA